MAECSPDANTLEGAGAAPLKWLWFLGLWLGANGRETRRAEWASSLCNNTRGALLRRGNSVASPMLALSPTIVTFEQAWRVRSERSAPAKNLPLEGGERLLKKALGRIMEGWFNKGSEPGGPPPRGRGRLATASSEQPGSLVMAT